MQGARGRGSGGGDVEGAQRGYPSLHFWEEVSTFCIYMIEM